MMLWGKASSFLTLKISYEQLSFHIGMESCILTKQYFTKNTKIPIMAFMHLSFAHECVFKSHS